MAYLWGTLHWTERNSPQTADTRPIYTISDFANKSHVWPRRVKAWWTNMAESASRIFVISDIWTFFNVNILFYHGYCKDQRNAAVIILRYAMLRHNALIMRSDTHLSFWHNVKKSVHLKFKIMPITCIFQRFRCGGQLTLYISY